MLVGLLPMRLDAVTETTTQHFEVDGRMRVGGAQQQPLTGLHGIEGPPGAQRGLWTQRAACIDHRIRLNGAQRRVHGLWCRF